MGAQAHSFRDFDEVRTALELPEAAGVWGGKWAESQRLYETEGESFLTPVFVEETCRFMRMAPDMAAAFRETLPLLKGNEPLLRLAWHCHCLMFRPPLNEGANPRDWPELPQRLGGAARMFYAFVYLSGVPFLRELHRARGITEEVTVDTLSDIEVWMRDYRNKHGYWAFFAQRGWLALHFRGDLYKLGRLQFEMRAFRLDFHAFRHRSRQRVIVLAGDGMRFRGDGQFDGVNGIHDSENAWTSQLVVDGSAVRGNPISPDGRAQRDPVRLPMSEWEKALRKDDPVLFVHIPATGSLTHAECAKSYRRAAGFFPAHFPQHAFRAFHSESWLLDHQLADYLPETSNIVRFQRDWHLLPSPGASDAQTLERVFGPNSKDPFGAPIKTSLQRHVIEHMKQGKRWRMAAGLIFPQDVEKGPLT